MAGRESLSLVKEFLFPNSSSRRSIPPLDAGLTPNDELDTGDVQHVVDVDAPDDALLDAAGDLVVTSGRTVLRYAAPDFAAATVVFTAPEETGALAIDNNGCVLVGVAGTGVIRVRADGGSEVVCDVAEGVPVHCPTAVAVASDGTVYVTDGSTKNDSRRWVHDLMEQNALGRLIRIDAATGAATVMRAGLSYPHGIALTEDEQAALLTESWAHRITRVPLHSKGEATELSSNLPGYPGRLTAAPGGGYWLAMFALRTQLVDFVLTQRDYVTEMMSSIEPDYWIRPALRSLDSGLEPLQGGQIRKLGVIKPWAPPRSYGLVVRLEEDGQVVSSMHSRGGGRRHGVTAVHRAGGDLVIAVKGGDQVLVTKVGDHR
jgi:hypothetical protein